MRLFRNAASIGLVAIAISVAAPAKADFVLQDQYWGGNDHGYGDSIGGGVFNVSSAVVSRPSSNILQIVINTAYAGAAGTDGTGYGALFLTPGAHAWQPTGSAPYATDIYKPGEWQYAFALPQLPSPTSGTAGLYLTSAGQVQLANVNGNPISWPDNGNSGWIFRDGQAVQFTPDQSALPVATGTWSVGVGTITMDIVDNGLFGDAFAMSWAMTCANDVIQGQVAGVPEPSTWAMLLLGFVGMALFGYRQQRRAGAGLLQPIAVPAKHRPSLALAA